MCRFFFFKSVRIWHLLAFLNPVSLLWWYREQIPSLCLLIILTSVLCVFDLRSHFNVSFISQAEAEAAEAAEAEAAAAATTWLIVLEPGVFLKSFHLLSQLSSPREKAPSLRSSSQLLWKKKKTCWGNFSRALILCYSRGLLHTHSVTHNDTFAALYNCLPPLSATRLFPPEQSGVRYLAQGHLYRGC